MKRKIIYIFILIFTLANCKNEITYKDKYSLVPGNILEFKLDNDSKNLSPNIQFITVQDSNYLAVANQTKNSVEIYNIETKTLSREITFNKEGNNSFGRMIGFLSKGPDTIIAISQMPQELGIINKQGEVLKRISYSRDIDGKPIQMTLPFAGQRPFFNDNDLFLGQFYRADESSGILTSIKQKQTYLNVKVDLKTGECKLLPPKYPIELAGKDIAGMYVNRVQGYNKSLVYHFGIIDGLFLTTDFINLKKVPIESNYHFEFPENYFKYITRNLDGIKYKIIHDEVQDIFYDQYKQCYYLIVRKRLSSVDKNTDINLKYSYPDCFIVILDKDLKHMGDVYFPENRYAFRMIFITPDGIYLSEDHINNPNYSEDYMRFRLFSLEKIKK